MVAALDPKLLDGCGPIAIILGTFTTRLEPGKDTWSFPCLGVFNGQPYRQLPAYNNLHGSLGRVHLLGPILEELTSADTSHVQMGKK